MIQVYCDACGARILGKKYIRAKVKIGSVKNVEVQVHAYAPNNDLCQTCLILAVEKAKEEDG